jgi:hypothetical protein
MVIDILFTLILEVYVAMGVYMITDKGKLLHCPVVKLSAWLNRLLGEKVSQNITAPLYDCITCMGSFWGAVVFLSFHLEVWYYVPIFMLASAGANTFVYSVYEKTTEN